MVSFPFHHQLFHCPFLDSQAGRTNGKRQRAKKNDNSKTRKRKRTTTKSITKAAPLPLPAAPPPADNTAAAVMSAVAAIEGGGGGGNIGRTTPDKLGEDRSLPPPASGVVHHPHQHQHQHHHQVRPNSSKVLRAIPATSIHPAAVGPLSSRYFAGAPGIRASMAIPVDPSEIRPLMPPFAGSQSSQQQQQPRHQEELSHSAGAMELGEVSDGSAAAGSRHSSFGDGVPHSADLLSPIPAGAQILPSRTLPGSGGTASSSSSSSELGLGVDPETSFLDSPAAGNHPTPDWQSSQFQSGSAALSFGVLPPLNFVGGSGVSRGTSVASVSSSPRPSASASVAERTGIPCTVDESKELNESVHLQRSQYPCLPSSPIHLDAFAGWRSPQGAGMTSMMSSQTQLGAGPMLLNREPYWSSSSSNSSSSAVSSTSNFRTASDRLSPMVSQTRRRSKKNLFRLRVKKSFCWEFVLWCCVFHGRCTSLSRCRITSSA